MPLPNLLKELLCLPTATFVEGAVLDYVRSFCGRLPGVRCRFDRHGNLLAQYRHRPGRVVPLVLAAHTDHPGFVAQEMVDRRTVRSAFLGFVETPYFHNARMRFWFDGRWIAGRVREVTRSVSMLRWGHRTSRPEEVLVQVREPIGPGSPGMWALPDPVLRGDRVHARDHDDIAGVAAMLAVLARLSRRRARAETYCLFTRAEELGFIGAIGAARARTVPPALPIVAIEMSKELPNARIGDGPILRVGDRMSVFTPDLTAFCGRVAQRLAERRSGFAFQRRLMDGGSCESTAYVAYGYRATGVCLALGNYHNMDAARGRIAPECISLRDWQRLVDWFEALVLEEKGYRGDDATLRAELDQRFESCVSRLRRSVRFRAGR